jgi:tetratricopeptide (TPR) repeat protein
MNQHHPTSPLLATKEDAAVAAFQKTLKLNNAAVQYLEKGQPEQAAKVLGTAFYAFKRAYNKQKQDLPSLYEMNDSRSNSTIEDVQSMLLNVSDLFSRKDRLSATNSNLQWSNDNDEEPEASSSSIDPSSLLEDQESGDGDISMHKSPIHLPVNYPITQESCAFLSTSITFNLAVASHLLGLEMWSSHQERNHNCKSVPKESKMMTHLQSAGRLYEYTLRLERARSNQQQALRNARVQQQHQQSGPSPSFPPLFVSPFVLMAILNNLGHLHWVLENYGQAKKCFRQLQSSLMYMLHIQNKTGVWTASGSGSSSPTPPGQRHPRNHHEMMQTFMGNASLGLGGGVKRMMAPAA